MGSAVPIAFAYFSAVPLQRWLSGVGAVLIAAGFVGRAFGPTYETAAGSDVALMLGIIFIALVPVMMGGAMMRIASSRKALHLLPRGRSRMLMGALLAITLLACMAAALFALGAAIPHPISVRKDLFTTASPQQMFGWFWSVGALAWVITFIISGSRLLSGMVGLLPLGLILAGRALDRRFPDSEPQVSIVFIVSALVWAGFAMWYLRAPAIKRSIYGSAAGNAARDAWLTRLRYSEESEASHALSPVQAIDQLLLGSSSRWTHLVIGVSWVLGGVLLMLAFRLFMALIGSHMPAPTQVPALLLVPSIMMTSGGVAFLLPRRSRLLWLRAGVDRGALFARAERSALSGSVLALGIPAVAFTSLAMVSWPDRATAIGVFAVAQILYCYCVFYGCLSLTRGWAVRDILLGVGLVALLVIEVLALRPWSDTRNAAGPAVLLALLLVITTLRWHARRRWLTLDWRVARMTQAMRGV